MKTMRARLLVVFGLLSVAVACVRQPRVKDVGLSVARLPPMAKIAIDGKADEPPWQKGAAMPFEKTGKAVFLWDESKVYGFVQKYEHQKFGFDFDEQVCISIRAGRKVVQLFFEEEQLKDRQALALREAWAADWLAETGSRQALPRAAVAVASLPHPTKRGFDWSVEFSVDLRGVSDMWPRGGDTSIIIYRLTPQRPITHAVRMERLTTQEHVKPRTRPNDEGANGQP
jgi:hypothetical protein